MNMRKIRAIVLALRIEYHWWRIKHYRKRFDVLYAAGLTLVSPKVQKINRSASKHTSVVMRCKRYYAEHYEKSLGGVL